MYGRYTYINYLIIYITFIFKAYNFFNNKNIIKFFK